jgi:hypothetical protein
MILLKQRFDSKRPVPLLQEAGIDSPHIEQQRGDQHGYYAHWLG